MGNLQQISRYNLWDGKVIPCGMLRMVYLDKIEALMGNGNVKVLTGQRRAGKSFVMRQIMMRLVERGVCRNNILYVSKEFLDFGFVETYIDMEQLYQEYRKEFSPQGRTYLFIDEVQNIDGWEKFVNSHSRDFTEDTEIFVTGSNAKLLSKELATLLSGRYVETVVNPYNYSEYLQLHGQERGRNTYLSFLQHGGLPGMYDITSEDGRRQYVSSVKDTILLRDIVQRHNIRDVKLLDDIFVFLVSNVSNSVSIQNVIRYFKSRGRIVNYETVSNYIQYIEDAYLVHGIVTYHIRGKQTSETARKYYVNDLSFKNYLYSGIAYGIGYLMENNVYLELREKGYDVYVGEFESKEIDFVAQKGDRIIYIQVTYSLEDAETCVREYSSLRKINDNYEKYVVSADEVQRPSDEGIRHVQVWNLSDLI